MWNLRNKTHEHRGKNVKKKRQKEANHKRLLTIGNKLRVDGVKVGVGWAKWVMY